MRTVGPGGPFGLVALRIIATGLVRSGHQDPSSQTGRVGQHKFRDPREHCPAHAVAGGAASAAEDELGRPATGAELGATSGRDAGGDGPQRAGTVDRRALSAQWQGDRAGHSAPATRGGTTTLNRTNFRESANGLGPLKERSSSSRTAPPPGKSPLDSEGGPFDRAIRPALQHPSEDPNIWARQPQVGYSQSQASRVARPTSLRWS